jgi:hypothetical protein
VRYGRGPPILPRPPTRHGKSNPQPRWALSTPVNSGSPVTKRRAFSRNNVTRWFTYHASRIPTPSPSRRDPLHKILLKHQEEGEPHQSLRPHEPQPEVCLRNPRSPDMVAVQGGVGRAGLAAGAAGRSRMKESGAGARLRAHRPPTFEGGIPSCMVDCS